MFASIPERYFHQRFFAHTFNQRSVRVSYNLHQDKTHKPNINLLDLYHFSFAEFNAFLSVHRSFCFIWRVFEWHFVILIFFGMFAMKIFKAFFFFPLPSFFIRRADNVQCKCLNWIFIAVHEIDFKLCRWHWFLNFLSWKLLNLHTYGILKRHLLLINVTARNCFFFCSSEMPVVLKKRVVRLVRDLTQQTRLFELSEMIMFAQFGENVFLCLRV